MNPAPTPPRPTQEAPALAARFAATIRAIITLIAARCLKTPHLLAISNQLANYLNRTARRLDRLLARAEAHLAAGSPTNPPPPPRPRTPRAPNPARFRVPTAHAWLLRAIPNEAANFANHLRILFADPDMVRLLAAAPTAGRLLRPICRLLALDDPTASPQPTPAKTPKPKPAPLEPPPARAPRTPRPRWFWPAPVSKISA